MRRDELERQLHKLFGNPEKIRVFSNNGFPGFDEFLAYIKGKEPQDENSAGSAEQSGEQVTKVDVKRFDGKVSEDGSCLIFYVAELPGVKESDIALQISREGGVSIRAKRKLAWEKEVIFQGVHSKVDENFDLDKASAKFEDGLLVVTVPVVVERAKTIKINS